MRPHLIQIFQLNKIKHFPRIIKPNDPKELFILDAIKKRKELAKKKRERRQIKINQDQHIHVKSDKSENIIKNHDEVLNLVYDVTNQSK